MKGKVEACPTRHLIPHTLIRLQIALGERPPQPDRTPAETTPLRRSVSPAGTYLDVAHGAGTTHYLQSLLDEGPGHSRADAPRSSGHQCQPVTPPLHAGPGRGPKPPAHLPPRVGHLDRGAPPRAARARPLFGHRCRGRRRQSAPLGAAPEPASILPGAGLGLHPPLLHNLPHPAGINRGLPASSGPAPCLAGGEKLLFSVSADGEDPCGLWSCSGELFT